MNPRVRKFSSLMFCPNLWPVFALGVMPALEHGRAFLGLEFDLIVDVGANKGQFAAFAATRWRTANLVCFEPLPGPRAKLEQVLRRVAPGRFDIRAKALGNEEGESTMHVATREDSSSLLSLGDEQRRLFKMEEARTETVSVARLDGEPNIFGQGRTLLKIDVQGFEYETLVGAGSRLQEFDVIYVECSFVELYQGQKLADDVIELVKAQKFEEAGHFNTSIHKGKLVQTDILFNRA